MNLQPSFDFWMSTVGVAAVGAALLMGLAGVVAMRCRSGRVQRAVWLGAFAATGLFLLGFVTGADRWLGTVRPATGPGEPMFLIRTDLPVEEAGFGETPSVGVSGGRMAAGEEVLFAGRAGWWPAWIWLGGNHRTDGRQFLRREERDRSPRGSEHDPPAQGRHLDDRRRRKQNLRVQGSRAGEGDQRVGPRRRQRRRV